MSEAAAIEICCCSGGMALGFRRAGIEFSHAFDKDPEAVASYEANLGHRPILIDVHDLLRMLERRSVFIPGAVDLIVADPPCVPWSTAGLQKGLDDERDCLRPIIEIVKILRPRAFLLGNVPGLEHANSQSALRDTVGSLSYLGYCVDEAVFDCADYGVPQHRVRPFWFCHTGSTCLSWPLPTHGPPSRQQSLLGTELLPWVTCRAALESLPVEEIGKLRRLKPQLPSDKGGGHPWSRADEPARAITARKDAGHGGGDVLEWPWDRPATTVSSIATIAQPGRTGRGNRAKPYHSANAIVLSERARLRLQGFPDDWKLLGKSKGSRNAMLGMAMPPPLAEAIGRSIANWLQHTSAAKPRQVAGRR